MNLSEPESLVLKKQLIAYHHILLEFTWPENYIWCWE